MPYAHVTAQLPAVKGETAPWCERFGSAHRGYFFAIRNPGPAVDLTLTLNRESLGIKTARFAAVTGCKIKTSTPDHITLSVPARWTAVVAVNRGDAEGLAKTHDLEMSR